MKETIMLICPLARTFNFREQLIFRLKDMGYDVVLVSEDGPEIDKFIKVGCRFENVGMDRRGTNVLNDLKLISDYRKIFKRINPDIVLLYTTKCSVYGGMVCRLLKIPYIVNNAGLIESKGCFAFVLNFLYKVGFVGATCMMYQNDSECTTIQTLLKNKTHYRKIPGSGVDLEQFAYCDYPPDSGEIVFNYVARVMKTKGIEEYLECAKQVHNKYPNTRFRIYGTFDDDCYQKKVAEYEKKGIVEYYGQMTDMRPAIASASAVIHPSYYEGMTNVVLEHSAMGRPCLGSNVPGVRDGIEEGVTGYIFEKGNVESMVAAVERFIELPFNQKIIMGENARHFMEKRFDRNIVTEIYVREIDKVLRN